MSIPLAEEFRRALTGGAAMLLIARSFQTAVPGDAFPAPLGGIAITLGWFVILLGTALWHAWARPGLQIGGWVALGLIVTASLVVMRAAVGTSSGWRANLAAWQWLSLPAVFVSVRQLTANRFDSRGLLAAIIATSVAAVATHLAPFTASLMGWDWPAPSPALRLVPDGADELATAFDSAGDSRRGAWSQDLFWLALAAPLVVLFAIRGRGLPPVFRWPLIVPSIMIVLGITIRVWNDPPPWPASWQPGLSMATSSPGGVGPGQYSRFAARHTAPESGTVHAEPPNSIVGLTATSGIAPLLALVGTLWLLVRSLRTPAVPEPPIPVNLLERARWELYVGGLVGLAGGFVLQVFDWPGGDRPPIAYLGAMAAIRGLTWFVVFHCAERAMSLEIFDRSVLPGLVAVVACAAIYDTMRPGLSEGFWAAAAIAVNLACPPPIHPWARSRPGRLLPLMAAVLLLVGFAIAVFLPSVANILGARQAVRQMPNFAGKLRAVERADSPPAQSAARSEAVRHIRRHIIQPLLEPLDGGIQEAKSEALSAALMDPGRGRTRDTAPLLVTVPWCIAGWELGSAGELDRDLDKLGIACALVCQAADSDNAAGYLAEFHARQRFATLSPNRRDEQFERLEQLIAQVGKRDPALEARLRFRIAAARFAAGNRPAGRREAAAARELDNQAPGPRYRLTDAERNQVHAWLEEGAP